MTAPISAEQMQKYKRTARERWQAENQLQAVRRERAWELARRAAALLKSDYGVERVVVFGSLTHPGRFNAWSDVDLAAWGLTNANWLKAMGAVRWLDEQGKIEINLVDVTCCAPELLAAVERDGVSV